MWAPKLSSLWLCLQSYIKAGQRLTPVATAKWELRIALTEAYFEDSQPEEVKRRLGNELIVKQKASENINLTPSSLYTCLNGHVPVTIRIVNCFGMNINKFSYPYSSPLTKHLVLLGKARLCSPVP